MSSAYNQCRVSCGILWTIPTLNLRQQCDSDVFNFIVYVVQLDLLSGLRGDCHREFVEMSYQYLSANVNPVATTSLRIVQDIPLRASCLLLSVSIENV